MPIPAYLECPHCNEKYDNFRTGFTFAEIVGMLWVDDDDPTRWRQKRRRSVLGFWHELKLEMWAEHVELCEPIEPADGAPQSSDVPIGY